MNKPCIFLLACLLLPFVAAGDPADGKQIPRSGVDTAGTWFSRKSGFGKEGWEYPAFRRVLGEIGVDSLVDHYLDVPTGGTAEQNQREMNARIDGLSAFLARTDIDFWWNLETGNWQSRLEFTPGENLLDYKNGAHFLMLPPEILASLRASPRVRGVVYDELEHMILNRNFTIRSDQKADIAAVVETTGLTMPQAYDALVGELSTIGQNYRVNHLGVAVEMVWPVMAHIFARSGWTLSPKLLKESWTPVPVAMALGACIEYEKQGANFWLTPDLWFCGHYPGHSVEELRSALAASHWLGAENIYVENLDYVHLAKAVHNQEKAKKIGIEGRPQGRHHPDADGVLGSLVSFQSADTYSLTAYGEVFKEYATVYRWKNPRPYTWRDARCRVAIVRFPDSCWGQDNSTMRDNLLGSKALHSSPETRAWFQIWNTLSHGIIPSTGLSFQCRDVKGKLPPRFFVPTPPVLVFDHRVGDEHPDFDFRGAKLIYLTGVEATPATLAAIEKAVRAGAVCISLPHLAPERVRGAGHFVKEGRGRWIVTERFDDPALRKEVAPFLSPEDEMQYLFGEHQLVFRKITDDQITVLLDGKVVHQPPAEAVSRPVTWSKGTLRAVGNP